MSVLSSFEPKGVFSYFEQIASMPHGSGNTKQISDYLVGVAKQLNLRYVQDKLGNVVIYKDGTKGYEKAPAVILQGHMDMVCAKEETCTKDMTKEGLDLYVEDGFIKARGTSLGADNGIAVAMALAVLSDNSLEHPPIEAVFTVDEETGLDGAVGLDTSVLKGRMLLNIDSEEEGIFTVSCAGGARLDCTLPVADKKDTAGLMGYQVLVNGLQGGHSGIDIDKGHASAILVAGRILNEVQKQMPVYLTSFAAGQFDNVICSVCTMGAAVDEKNAKAFEKVVSDTTAVIRNEYKATEPNLAVTVTKENNPNRILDKESTNRIINLLMLTPYGVQEMSMEIPGTIQTSLNLGIANLTDDAFGYTYLVRSSYGTQKMLVVDKALGLCGVLGGQGRLVSQYPSWEYRKESRLRDLMQEVFEDQYGKKAEICSTHGGLECGIFYDKMPGLDCVSFGPELYDVHSPRERLGVDSTARLWKFLCEVLKRCK